MAFSFLGSTGASAGVGGNTVTTGGVTTTGSTFIVLGVPTFDGAAVPTVTVTDSNTNTWTRLNTYSTTVPRFSLYYCYAPIVGAGHTFTVTGTAIFPSVYAMWFSGVISSPFDQQNGFGGASTLSGQPGSITPTQNYELVITGLNSNQNTTSDTISAGYTIPTGCSSTYIASQHFGGAMAYNIQSVATTTNPTWTYGTGTTSAAIAIASFKSNTPLGSGSGFFSFM